MQYLCCYEKALQHSLYQYGLFSARFMFTDLSDIDETAQAKVGAEIWTVKPDKAPHSKGTKSKATVPYITFSPKSLYVFMVIITNLLIS